MSRIRSLLVLGSLGSLALLVLAGCTARSAPTVSTITSTTTRTVVHTTSPPVSGHAVPVGTVAPLAVGASPHRGERDRFCPYIATGLDQQPDGDRPNVADIEGDRIYRSTVLTGLHPVGCRFYFYSYPYEALTDIRPYTFPSAVAAHNALVLTARRGTQPISKPDFVPGVDGILFRTPFYAADGTRDWAFGFAKGRVLVLIRTQRDDTALPALLLGRAVVAKF